MVVEEEGAQLQTLLEVEEVVVAQCQMCQSEVVVEEEEVGHLLLQEVEEVVVEVDCLLILEEVAEVEGIPPLQGEVEAGTCHVMERLLAEGEVAGHMWVRSRRGEWGGQCPWREAAVVVERA